MLAEDLNPPNKPSVSFIIASFIFTAILGAVCGALVIWNISSILLPLAIGLVLVFFMSLANAFEGNPNSCGNHHIISSIILCGGGVVASFTGAVVGCLAFKILYSGNNLTPDEIQNNIFMGLMIGSILGTFVGVGMAGSILGFNEIGGEKNITPFQIYSAIFISAFLVVSFLVCFLI